MNLAGASAPHNGVCCGGGFVGRLLAATAVLTCVDAASFENAAKGAEPLGAHPQRVEVTLTDPKSGIAYALCNAVAFDQIPTDLNLFIGRVSTDYPTSCALMGEHHGELATLALFRMDWKTNTLNILQSAHLPQTTVRLTAGLRSTDEIGTATISVALPPLGDAAEPALMTTPFEGGGSTSNSPGPSIRRSHCSEAKFGRLFNAM